MPTERVFFQPRNLDERIEARAEVARLRAHPHVVTVEAADDSTYQQLVYVVTYADVADYAEPDGLRLREILRRLAPSPPPVPPEEASQSWGGILRRAIDQLRVPERLISEALTSSSGRSRLAAQMIHPLRARRDYTSIGRRTFLVEELPQGALPIYETPHFFEPSFVTNPTDPNARIRVPIDGPTPAPNGWMAEEQPGIGVTNPRAVSRLTGERVQVPEFEIASNPTIHLADIRSRRFDLIERTPSVMKPEWAGVGVWVCLKDDPRDYWVITDVSHYQVQMQPWRGVFRTVDVSFAALVERYVPCLAPAEPTTRFERILEVA